MKISEVIMKFGDSFSNPVCLVNMGLADQPLIYVNQDFCALTGYAREQILGRNCRFLRGPLTDPEAVKKIRGAIADLNPVSQDLINYNAQFEIFYNRLVLIPFKDGPEKFFIGLQHVISKDMFKHDHGVDDLELLDKTINPLSVMMGLLKRPTADIEKDFRTTTLRLKNYVLSL